MKPKDTESGHITSTGDDHAQTIVQPLIGAVEDFTRVHGFLREDGRARGGAMGTLGSLYDLRNDSDLFSNKNVAVPLHHITTEGKKREDPGMEKSASLKYLLSFYTRSHEP